MKLENALKNLETSGLKIFCREKNPGEENGEILNDYEVLIYDPLDRDLPGGVIRPREGFHLEVGYQGGLFSRVLGIHPYFHRNEGISRPPDTITDCTVRVGYFRGPEIRIRVFSEWSASFHERFADEEVAQVEQRNYPGLLANENDYQRIKFSK